MTKENAKELQVDLAKDALALLMVFSVRLRSATTRLVVMGSRPRSPHSTEA